MVLLLGLQETPLTSIQVLYCNLISACTLGFVAAIEPAEDGNMDHPPRRVGKRLIGRYLFILIVIGTMILIITTVGSVFWVQAEGYNLEQQRAQAMNVLSFGAIALTMSARFTRLSAFHIRTFQGNVFANWSYMIVIVLQIIITYTPGVNNTVGR